MKTKLTLLVASTLLSLSTATFAVESAGETSSPEKKDTSFFDTTIQKLRAASPSLSRAEITLDDSYFNKNYDKFFGEDVIPVMISGGRFMASKDGSVLSRPDATFYTSTGSLQLAQSQLLKLDMDPSVKSKWPSLKVPEGVEKKGDLFVLTDPTCGYCHKVEEDMDVYLSSGIEVHYIPYPRAGVHDIKSQGMALWGAAACSDEPAKAYHEISTGAVDKYPLPKDANAECLDVVKEGYAYGRKIGISGTPFMYIVNSSQDSYAQPGYARAVDLLPKVGLFVKDAGAELFE
tara:strand:- start:22 stop:891 length:870 start_codon:yes stop_codon:yes gene_type:complete